MNPTRSLVIAALLITAAIFALVLAYRSERLHRQEMEEARLEISTLEAGETDESAAPLEVTTFVWRPLQGKAPTEQLEQRKQQIAATDNPLLKARRILNLVIQESAPLVPAAAQVKQVFMLEDGTAVVDLSREAAEQFQGGIGAELGVLLSLTRSLRTNIPSVQEVRFLVDGEERPTFSGHVTLQTSFM